MAIQTNQIIKCPWCRSEFKNPSFANCPNCGGTMEYKENPSDLGPRPPDAPRQIPKIFIKKIKYTGNVLTILGMIFTLALFWTIIFPIIGIFLWKRGIKNANNELTPLQYGSLALGEITSVRCDYSTRINNRSPFIVEFTFEANSQKYRGEVDNIFEEINTQKKPGDQVWVVYMPENPKLSSVWPPLV